MRFPALVLTGVATLLSLVGVSAAAQGLPKGFSGSANPHVEKWAYILLASKWPTTTVYVCWENPTTPDERERAWVEKAVATTWQAASGLQFRGWGPCAEKVEGIRIRIADDGPHVKALGRGLDGMGDGMVLNFVFSSWSPACKASDAQRKACVESIAVHEFGHAIGFAHEQNRPDAPGECAALAQGSNGDVLLTPYDPRSVMNYCNPVYNNGGKLSLLDTQAVQELYGPPSKAE